MRNLLSVVIAATVLSGSAHAAPLPAGKPAGVEKAALGSTTMLIAVSLGMAVLIGGLGIAFGNATSSDSTD